MRLCQKTKTIEFGKIIPGTHEVSPIVAVDSCWEPSSRDESFEGCQECLSCQIAYDLQVNGLC